jgi:hypothetical protein
MAARLQDACQVSDLDKYSNINALPRGEMTGNINLAEKRAQAQGMCL